MPACATCGGYVSTDFVRVFGDNDRTVRACLTCRGTDPEPTESDEPTALKVEAVAAIPSEGDGVETLGRETRTLDDETDSTVDADRTDEDEDEASVASPDGEAVSPGTAVVGDQSRFGFLRSVFLKQRP